jgi:hypothetical protein
VCSQASDSFRAAVIRLARPIGSEQAGCCRARTTGKKRWLETRLLFPDGPVWSFRYGSAGQPLTVTAPDGGVSTFDYDLSTGLLDSISEPGSRTEKGDAALFHTKIP